MPRTSKLYLLSLSIEKVDLPRSRLSRLKIFSGHIEHLLGSEGDARTPSLASIPYGANRHSEQNRYNK
jgi:hypothetical protein